MSRGKWETTDSEIDDEINDSSSCTTGLNCQIITMVVCVIGRLLIKSINNFQDVFLNTLWILKLMEHAMSSQHKHLFYGLNMP